jgi:hypothetical protein
MSASKIKALLIQKMNSYMKVVKGGGGLEGR